MRQLRLPLLAASSDPALADPPTPTPDGRGLLHWAAAVRGCAQSCLLVSMDGAVIAVSDAAAKLLGADCRPGVPVQDCWHELSLQAGEAPPKTSLLSRTMTTGSAAHSVLSLELPRGPATLQVMVAPLQVAGPDPVALLAFLWPLASSNGAANVHVPEPVPATPATPSHRVTVGANARGGRRSVPTVSACT